MESKTIHEAVKNLKLDDKITFTVINPEPEFDLTCHVFQHDTDKVLGVLTGEDMLEVLLVSAEDVEDLKDLLVGMYGTPEEDAPMLAVFPCDRVGDLVDRLKSYVDSNWFWGDSDIQAKQHELEDILQGYFGFSKERIEEIKHEATIEAKGKVLRAIIGVIGDDIPESDG
jgi:hypothetical protein